MKLIIAMILTGGSLFAGPLLPTLSPDSQTLDPWNPGIGAKLYVTPNTNWLIGANDNACLPWLGICGDGDYNDAMAYVSFDSNGFAAVYWIGINSAIENYLIVQGMEISPQSIGSFSGYQLGSEVSIEMHTGEGNVFFAGHRNVGVWGVNGPGLPEFTLPPHIPVNNPPSSPSGVPEPGTFGLIGVGLVGIGLWKRKRGKG